jgi:hypothetical protein
LNEAASTPAPEATSEGLEDEPEETEEQEPLVASEPGAHRFVWTLRLPDAVKVPEDVSIHAKGSIPGPTVPPGRYQVRLTSGGHTASETFEILKDPRVSASQEDLQAQFAFLVRIQQKLNQTHEAINRIRALRMQAQAWQERLKGPASAGLRGAAAALDRTLLSIEEELIQSDPGNPLGAATRLNVKLAVLTGVVESADAAPTRQSYELFEDLSNRIDVQLERFHRLMETDLQAFNQQMQSEAIPAMSVPPS